MKKALTMLLFFVFGNACAQQDNDWQRYFDELAAMEDLDVSTDWEQDYELYTELAKSPINLNNTSREQIEQLPFLTPQQSEDLVEYLERYGPVRSKAELLMVKSLELPQRKLLEIFTYIGDPQTNNPSLAEQIKRGHHDLSATARIPLYERQGDRDGSYRGYPYRHTLRYQFDADNRLKFGLTAAQDAGEPFFADKNSLGYDHYALYAMATDLGRVERLAVGTFRLSEGMGLVLNNNLSFGKLATLQTLGRRQQTLRVGSSRTEGRHFQGLAATIRLHKQLKLTAFLSWRPYDGTPAKGDTISNINITGYHRTTAELDRKGNTRATAAGANLTFRHKRWTAALTTVYTHLNRYLMPQQSMLYRRYYPTGTDFLNASIDYRYASRKISVGGETAIDKDGALATINTVSITLPRRVSLLLLQRFYSYRYNSPYAQSFADGGSVKNESGLYLGATWEPTYGTRLSLYADFVYFPWARYQISQSSHSQDLFCSFTRQTDRWGYSARYRLRLREKDSQGKTTLTANNTHRARIQLTYSDNNFLRNTLQTDLAIVDNEGTSCGFMLSDQATIRHRWLAATAHLAYFHTDDYASRIYCYERGMLYDFSFPSFYGEGIRYALLATATVSRKVQISAKIGITNYFDRATIGTGHQKIDASSMADVDFQLRLSL